MNSGPFLLVKARDGLGNRLLCALTGLLYARLTHRQLVIDWSDPVYSAHRGLSFPPMHPRAQRYGVATFTKLPSISTPA